ncbi:hypothetical protein [Acetobacterium sp.]|uniref:hypothetical protein n=1 Tax=Acetobacterium sp. TaxID=1872094 RepID=UPI0027203D86|nr:hypothetical protein [Acetobacterium sp.]MDO9492563.1 hypothetical protein [Acetobacterium sp.]
MQGLKIKVDSSNLKEVIEKLNQAVMLANELKELLDSNGELKKMSEDDCEAFKKGKITINEMRKKHGLEPLHGGDEKLTAVKKEIKDMTEKEILRQQLELLAEISVTNAYDNLGQVCSAMVEICEAIKKIET